MESSLPTNFKTLVVDFTKDLTNTFPEYEYLWKKWYAEDATDADYSGLMDYCKKIYPQRFFDILYQNLDIFEEKEDVDTYFLPNVSFKFLFTCEGITETTKKAIWKYLQLILFSVVNEVKDKAEFGDTMNLFDGMEESTLQEKLQETLGSINEFFTNIQGDETQTDDVKEKAEETKKGIEKEMENIMGSAEKMEEMKKKLEETMPNLENFQEHLRGLFDGKIGSLAKEMAEEIADDFRDLVDENDAENPQDVIKKLMKNPGKISELMKTVGKKLDTKMKSGEISKDELMKEATEMLGKMRGMGGEGELNDMLKSVMKNMGGMGKNMRMDTNALDRMTRKQDQAAKVRERSEIKKRQQEIELERLKLEQQKQITLQNELRAKYSMDKKGENDYVFKINGEDIQEKSFVHPEIIEMLRKEEEDEAAKKKEQGLNPKKKKNKKKKGKK